MRNRLFFPITIKGKYIRNRSVMPPMVCFGEAENDGFVTDKHIEHYKARARGGTGLIIVEAAAVHPDGRLSADQLGIWSDKHIQGLSKIAHACHQYGAITLIQIHHAGLKTPQSVVDIPVGPSKNYDNPSKALSMEEIENIKKDFVEAASRAKKAGFDGIELHGAHGYLLNQFTSCITNRRKDEYGGGLAGRMKLPVDIIRLIAKESSRDDFIIGYRMGGNDPTLSDSIKIAKELEEAGIDLLHVSKGIQDPDNPLPQEPKGFPFNWIVYAGTEIRKNVSIPVIVVNGIRTPKQAALIVENRLADFVAIGRGHLSDPEWTNKAMDGLEPTPCIECQPRCHWYTNGDLCPRG
ncbi:MAG: NADH:flavin oxidoreductase [Clostridiales bacterium]|nr:NADH:flavin oxidoreductase [Clostridiales bacterium]